MARHIVLGNGTILVGLDQHAQLRDFYYPYVGEENHVAGQVHRFGVWSEGQISWFDEQAWQKKLSYTHESLVGQVDASHEQMQVALQMHDAVLHNKNIYLRRIAVTNTSDKAREVRLFCHQHFDISAANIGNTVYYNPLLEALVYYRGQRYFLIGGCQFDDLGHISALSSYTTGAQGEQGKEGTFRDAEDGVLSEHPIEHGSVDSTVAFHVQLKPQETRQIYFWICVGKTMGGVTKLQEHVRDKHPATLLEATKKHWVVWVNRTDFNFLGLSERVVDLFKRSLLLINTHVDKGGSIIASSDSDTLYLKRDTYAYMWPRDGALIARSLDRAQYKEITKTFFQFCCKVLADDGYLFHKYLPDGSLGSSWHSWLKEKTLQLPIQEDQIALVLDALWKHFVQNNDEEFIKELFKPLIRKAGDFMLRFIDSRLLLPLESYDLWEEKLGIHTFTCAAVYAGFQAAANFEDVFGSAEHATRYRDVAASMKKSMLKHLYDEESKTFIKGLYYKDGELHKDKTLDASSVYGIFHFGVLECDDKRVEASFETFEKQLHCNTAVGGYARYVGDRYHRVTDDVPGNPWILIYLWCAEHYIARAKNQKELDSAIKIFEWVADRALETGVLAEQLDPRTGAPLSVAPLTWSHAGVVIAINKYLEKLEELGICDVCNPPARKDN